MGEKSWEVDVLVRLQLLPAMKSGDSLLLFCSAIPLDSDKYMEEMEALSIVMV
jgi:hypothetical protein